MSKLYRTSGTGSSQQTLDVNDEKIKIYADETSLDADLANIDENEIVATNEEDSQRVWNPVDVVQDGNMSAVTSNAVADAISYSTTEQKTGGHWIDGKPIYRKVVDCGALPNNTEKTVAHNIANIEWVVKYNGMASNGNEWLQLPASYYSTAAIGLSADSTNIFLRPYSNRTSYTTTLVTIEYTKTTD